MPLRKFLLCVLFALFVFVAFPPAWGEPVKTYPGPAGVSASNVYSVRVFDGTSWSNSFVYRSEGLDGRGDFRAISYTNFEMSTGPVTVEVTNLSGEITDATIRPKRYGLAPLIDGNRLTFVLQEPRKVSIEINGNGTAEMCSIFANAPDGGPPSGTTRYYGPGVHTPGVVSLASNEIVYVAGGAYVKGVFQFGEGTSGQQILGYGIISGEDEVGREPAWSRMNGTQKFADWTFANSHGQTIRDVTFVQPADPFLLWIVDGTLVQNVKFLAHPANGRGAVVGGEGGIAIYGKSQPFLLRDCFAVTTDDCYKFEYNDITGSVIEESTVANFGGSPLGGIWNDVLGSNTRGVTVQNCDVIATTNTSYSVLEGLVYAMPPNSYGTHGPVYDLIFRNIVVENDNTPFNRLCGFAATERGEIYNIRFENIILEKQPLYRSVLQGHDTFNRVRDITFKGVRINGIQLNDENVNDYFNIDSATTSNIRFDPSDGSNENLVWVDDRNSSVTYSGSWMRTNESPDFAGTESYSNGVGDFVEFTFTGTGIEWIGAKNANLGKVDIYLDGELQVAGLDLFATRKIFQSVLFRKKNLTQGEHTIRVKVSGNLNPRSSAAYLVMDAFRYTVPRTYSQWANDVFPPSTPNDQRLPLADANSDGHPNVLSFAIGMHPNDQIPQNRLPAPSISTVGSDQFLELQFERSPEAAGLMITPEVSNNLSLWRSDGTEVSIIKNLPDLLVARSVSPIAITGKSFLRLQINIQE